MNEQIMQMLTQQMAGGKQPAELSALMMQLLQEKQNKSESSELEPLKMDKLHSQLRQAKKIIRAQRAQLEIAAEFINQFADLIGACPECLGQVEECRRCGGEGGPGSRSPDPQLLKWIEPALQRVQIDTPNQPQH